MENKKLCLAIPSLQAGGMERVMSELSFFFCQKNNLEVHLILYGITCEIFYSVPNNLIIHKPNVVFNNKYRAVYTIGRLYYLRKVIKKIKPDSVLSFGELWNSFVLLALIGLSYPVYISDRCSPVRKFNAFHSFLRKTLYPKAEGIIAQTDKAKEIYYEQFKHRNIVVIGNPIREINVSEKVVKQNIVLMVGRLIKSKNQDKLIEMFLNISIPGWRLLLVGYDHLKQNYSEYLKAIIENNQAEQKVFLEGKKSNVESYYEMSRVFAFTSSSEGFPNAIGEAMSAGLPVVTFDCVAGPSEMITDNVNGFLVPLFNFEKFQERLKLLMTDSELRETLGRSAKRSVRKFSLQKIGEQYINYIIGKSRC
jgi:GalNAc-alpha-(1->4)-GalNAc-alpha-(1->3)-diNAcBac-PP-undecaprenol alpha-1,4-N-acetyl-D-galactosaminyltransferase